MKKTKKGWYRSPGTLQERRANTNERGFARGKRLPRNLPDDRDGKPHLFQKTWKVKRRKQYRQRGAEHKIFLPEDGSPRWSFWVNTWELEEWFNDHDIPYRLRKVEQTETKTEHYRREWTMVGSHQVPYTYHERPRGNGACKTKTRIVEATRWEAIYAWRKVKLAKPRTYKVHKLLGYELTWWYDKDIGIEQLLQRFSRPKSNI